jgi:RNA polymerase sigma factor (sigma-70 family)
VSGLWQARRRRDRGGDEPDAPLAAPRLRVVSDQAYPGWEAIYRDNVSRIYALMYAKVGNRADAEDLTSEVFLAALGPLRTQASVPEVRAYLAAVARTTLAGYWRRTLGRQVTVIDQDRLPEQLVDLPAASAQAGESAAGILAALPDRYAQVLRLRFIDGYSVAEVAAVLGITSGTARVLQFRALRRAAEVAADVAGREAR